jgi:hypothetical protein
MLLLLLLDSTLFPKLLLLLLCSTFLAQTAPLVACSKVIGLAVTKNSFHSCNYLQIAQLVT